MQPTTVGLLGHRFQVRAQNTVSGQTLVVSRLQRFEPSIRQDTTVYYELGTVDPVGYASDPPQFTIALEENVHNAAKLDLLLAGKNPSSDTSWNLGNYNVGNGPITLYMLERDNSDVVQGEREFNGGLLSDITWTWTNGQPITGRYTVLAKVGKNWVAGSQPHLTWGTQDTTSQGAIRPKDCRLYLNGSTDAKRVYRVQSMTMRVAWRTQVVMEFGNRAVVGILAEPPDVTLDVDIAMADHQPDDVLYVTGTGGGNYYDYQNYNLLTASMIKIFDPTAGEGATLLRSWVIEKMCVGNASPSSATVRGLSTKRYSFVRPSVTTANSAGVLFTVA